MQEQQDLARSVSVLEDLALQARLFLQERGLDQQFVERFKSVARMQHPGHDAHVEMVLRVTNPAQLPASSLGMPSSSMSSSVPSPLRGSIYSPVDMTPATASRVRDYMSTTAPTLPASPIATLPSSPSSFVAGTPLPLPSFQLGSPSPATQTRLTLDALLNPSDTMSPYNEPQGSLRATLPSPTLPASPRTALPSGPLSPASPRATLPMPSRNPSANGLASMFAAPPSIQPLGSPVQGTFALDEQRSTLASMMRSPGFSPRTQLGSAPSSPAPTLPMPSSNRVL